LTYEERILNSLPTFEEYKELYPYDPNEVFYDLDPLDSGKQPLCAVVSSERKKAVDSLLEPPCGRRERMLNVLGLCEADTAYNLENLS